MAQKPDRIICILDRSGSMASVRDDAIGGFNTFLSEQQKVPGKARLTLVLFNHDYTIAVADKKLGKVKPLTEETYVPAGTTALFDAIGRTVVDARVNDADYKKTIVAILTDGMENASSDYTEKADVRKVVEEATDAGYEFFFLAANMDAFAEGGSFGIAQSSISSYTADSSGTRVAYATASAFVADARTGAADTSD